MSVEEEKEILEALINEIENAADDEIRKIIEEAEKQRERILRSAEEKALQERRRREEEVRRKARISILKELSFKRISFRRDLLVNKYKVIMGLIEEARKWVLEEAEKCGSLYRLGLENLVEEAILNIKSSDIVVVCNKRDKEVVEEVSKKISGKIKDKYNRNINVVVKSSLPENEYGVIVHSADSKEYYINTISSRFEYYVREYLPELLSKKV
ncbi:MAG: hypothetical protein DRJ64_07490 [Thermoprotei archaeon]|nr:MAG: hypothetical protein DRJ64_07490 [Thermoprotei archaeon]